MVNSVSTPGSVGGRDPRDDLRRTVQAGESLVDSHSGRIPSLRTLEPFLVVILSPGGHPNSEALFLRASDQVSSHLLPQLHMVAGEGASDLVSHRLWLHRGSSQGHLKATAVVRIPG